jgi:hypothetical protein
MKIFGHHKISRKGKDYYLIVIEDIFEKAESIEEMYDLKGSKVGREANVEEKVEISGTDEINISSSMDKRNRTTVVLKDNDYLLRNRKIYLSVDVADEIMKQIVADCQVNDM